jgi:hypothetical protein
MRQFEGNPYDQGLAQMSCYAVRDVLLDELDGIKRPAAEVLEDVLSRVQPPVPTEARTAFRSLEREFEGWVSHVRSLAKEEGVDLADLADALKSARQLAKAVAQQAEHGSK